ncbi:hypothetical protein [Actinomadura sp. BRA 177]|uniref:hypothetical protein n=1 Tax=Actinomadura sp. BRA 177 TaxID=2745202 RepID=UPI001595DAE2|nr:hypothetical protein [Actinomadura sp. BRA 177]NVI92334.1 hypothetical protein [Actinomadura sp. BRA 177]
MTLAIIPARPRAPAAPRGSGPRRAPGWLLAAGVLAQVALRLWLARTRTAPAASPDEAGYLIAARWLAGGPGADLSGNTFYQGGYPLLLAPVYLVTRDPAAVYAAVLVINALAGAALFPLGYAAARRFGLVRRAALPLAFGAALLPATTFFGAFALADAVLPAIVLAWLLALDRFVRSGRTSDAVLASAAASYAAAVHTRGAVLLAVHAVVLAVLALRPVRRRAALLAGGAALAGYAAGAMLNAHIRDALYPGGVRDLAGILESRLGTAAGQEWALSGAAGQVWYLIASTWGLAGVGLAAAAAALVRRRTPGAARVMAAVLLAATCGIAYASSAALPDEYRVGNFAYGRYLSCLALVYALAGAVVLLRSGARTAVRATAASVLVLEGAGLWVAVYAGDRLRTHEFIAFDFPEITFLTGDRTALHLREATLTAIALCGALLLLSRLDRTPLAAVGLTGVNLAAMAFVMAPSRDRPFSPLPGPAAGGVVADVSLDWEIKTRLMYPVWWTRIGRIDVRDGRPPASGVCTVLVPAGTSPETSWPAHPVGWRAHARPGWVAWHDPACGTAQ